MNIRAMISKAAANVTRQPGGLGSGEAELGASTATPVRAYRPVDSGGAQVCSDSRIGHALCRVVGFISLSRRSHSKVSWWKRRIER